MNSKFFLISTQINVTGWTKIPSDLRLLKDECVVNVLHFCATQHHFTSVYFKLTGSLPVVKLNNQWPYPWQTGRLDSLTAVRTQVLVRISTNTGPLQSYKAIYITTLLQLKTVCSSGCYGFWCCPCLACTVSGNFGEDRCLPLCDMCSPAITAACGLPLCVPPAAFGLRVGIRHRYNIKVSHV